MRDQHARIAPAIFRSLRGVWDKPSETSGDDHAGEQSFDLLSFSQLDGWAASIRTSQIAPKHQAVEGRVFDTMVDVSAQQGKQPLAGIVEPRDVARHAFRQRLETRRRYGRQ